MEQQLATEPGAESAHAAEPQQPSAHLENWAANERMRHIPGLEWIIRKLDVDVRERLSTLHAPLTGLNLDDPRRRDAEERLRAVCAAIDRLASAAKAGRPATAGMDVPSRAAAALTQALTALRSLESSPFGRRAPFHHFERSRSESVYAALLVVLCRLESAVPLVREIDPTLDQRLLAGLVTLTVPDDERMRQPIA